MTLEKAIKLLKQYQGYEPMFPDGGTLKHAFDLTDETVNTLLTALRPVSREQVEKVWGSCKVCNGEMTLYQHTNTTKLYMDTFGKAATLVTECNACPPHADCCMKGISANSAFIINYCPECGRPLTDEAVQMMTDKMLLDAIMQTAKEKGITDLYVLNEDFIMDAIREKMEREAKKEE